MQEFFLRWLPLGMIFVLEAGFIRPQVLEALGHPEVGGIAGILLLGGVGVSVLALLATGIPDPNAKTPWRYLGELVVFAIVILPFVCLPSRQGH